MNAKYIVGSILIALGIAVLSQTGSLTSSQMVYYPFAGASLFIGTVLCYVEYTSDKSKNLRLDTDLEG
jgi:drug/metabolite transporter (DMT)-like permease